MYPRIFLIYRFDTIFRDPSSSKMVCDLPFFSLLHENTNSHLLFHSTEGHEEVMKNATELLGCPFTGPWSLEGKN